MVVLFNHARHPQGLYSAVETGTTFFSLLSFTFTSLPPSLANPVNHCAGIETLHPRVRRPVVVQSKIGSIPWECVQSEKPTRETKSFPVRLKLKLGPGEPCAVERECQPTIILVAKNRRLQNIDRCVVETFENRVGKVCVRKNNQGDRTNDARNPAGRTKHQRPVLHSRWCRRGVPLNNELRVGGEYE